MRLAKKLKQAWIEKKKLKRAYLAEKRKAGPDPGNAISPKENVADDAEDNDEASEESISENGEEIMETPRRPNSEELSGHTPTQSTPVRRQAAGRGRGRGNSHHASRELASQADKSRTQASSESRPSLRDLAREAYSPSSLHTYKSDPLHRRKDDSRGGRGRGRGGHDHRGRGQPDMKKRMGVILAQLQGSHA
jgi:hypothetical protein